MKKIAEIRIKRCPVCEEKVEVQLVETHGKYSIFGCPSCKLQFADPLEYSSATYDKAYKADGELSNTRHYDEIMLMDLALIERGITWFEIFPREHVAIKWLRNNIPIPSYILDLGCSGGRFLSLLKKYGFFPLGMDVASKPIELLKEKGFQVECGSIDNYPTSWPNPFAITLLEILEHLPDPMGFLRRIIARFPETPLIVSVPSPRRFTLQNNSKWLTDYPPHHLTRWKENTLLIALNKAGYRGKVIFPRVSSVQITGSHVGDFLRGILSPKQEVYTKQNNVLLSEPFPSKFLDYTLLFRIKRIAFWPYAQYLNLLGYRDISMVGIGIPAGLPG